MGETVRPENAFVLAALRRDAHAADARRAAANAVTDWAAVAALAVAHDVSWHVLRALPGDASLDAAREPLTAAVNHAAISGLAAARQLTELHGLLQRAGVRAVAYKGPALAVDVHADLAARVFTDLDMLIAEHDRARADEAMRAAGYVPPSGFTRREARVYSRWEGVAHFERGADWPVELHWRCQAPRYGGPQDPAAIVARAVPRALGGGTVLVPVAEDLGVLLALHGAKHAWTSMMWLADFAAAVTRPAFHWTVATERASAWGVQRAWHYAVRVASTLVCLPVPERLLAAARGDARITPLVDAACARLSGASVIPDVGAESTPRYDLQWLDGTLPRLRYLALATVLPTPADRMAARLPDVLLPLAYPLRAVRVAARAMAHAATRHE